MVLEKTLKSPLDCKEIQPVHSEGDQPWDFFGGNDAEAETAVLWPPHATSWLIGKDWCWEGLGARGEGDDRGWDGWMALLTQWTWVWVNSGSWWWTGRPGVLWFMGSQRVEHDWATDLIWSDQVNNINKISMINVSCTCLSFTNCKHLAQVDSSVKGLDYLWGFVYSSVGSNQCSLLDFEMSPMMWISFCLEKEDFF